MATDAMSRTAAGIDRLTDRLGKGTAWLTLGMVLLGSFNTVARYVDGYRGRRVEGDETFFRFSSNALLEFQWYLFSLVFLLGAAYALRHGSHVRVDLVYGRLSRRGKAWIDLLGGILLLLPFCLFSLWVSWPSVHNSWGVREMSPDPGGLPRYPIKAMILVAFVLLVLQGVSEILKCLVVLRRDEAPESGAGPRAPAADGEAGSHLEVKL